MSGYLQRLLARVAPQSPGFALTPAPVNLPRSPLVDADQRIALPEFSDIGLPVDAVSQISEPLQTPSSEGMTDGPKPKEGHGRRPAKQAPVGRSNVRNVSPTVDAAGIAEHAVTKLEPKPARAISERNSAPAVSEPQQAVPDIRLHSPMAIAPEDFEPAADRAVDAVAAPSHHARLPQAEDARPGHSRALELQTAVEPVEPARSPARQSGAEAAPQLRNAVDMPSPAPPLPVAEAIPDLPHPASLEALEAAAAPAAEIAASPKIVIEQIVIDIVPPAAPAAQPRVPETMENSLAPSAPMTAEAASIIGQLPQSRPFAALFGMRRR